LPGGDGAYALPELPTQQIAPEDHLRRVLGEWAVDVTSSQNLVIVRTPPGCAHVVGSALDRSAMPGLLGTVAGDDTVMVVVAEGQRGRDFAAQLSTLAGLDGPAARGRRAAASVDR
jgi:transcriptional regulator of arginine metabolism